ncbi:MAG: NAD(P)H-dependent oxidoreductase subunit E [Spirochaetes bacterium]|nr:NAD(P)H-dependent oxidoreductase subunit E [Spirochaetota bacterium]MBU0956831.1 NAD(P)H-dependent oxidoreductase subunit E [Spirochaetota bacterium]
MKSRDTLLGALHERQHSSGQHWLPPQALAETARQYGLTAAAVKGVATYYSMFSLVPRGRHIIRFCVSPVCRMFGSQDLLEVAAKASGARPGERSADGLFSLEEVQCLGRCAGAPAMMIDDHAYARLTPDRIKELISTIRTEASVAAATLPADAGQYAVDIGPQDGPRIALRFMGLADPADVEQYRKAGGYAGLQRALSLPPDSLVTEFTRAGVRGRGGAGFPAGLKERAAAGSACSDNEECQRYVVCNADEGEPGTFKDRIILESSPQLLIEGIIISAYAVGARRGFIYLRGEYGRAITIMRQALASAYAAGLLGQSILGSDFSFDLELRLGAGSYLCGEELTLIESLEGKRGYPRIKPPFPAESGLWGKPTLVNNVETLASLPWVVEQGGDGYLALGTKSSPGTKVFCLSGDVAKPGYGEWPMGLSLGELLAAGGGCLSSTGRPVEKPLAVLLGGAAGCFVQGDDPALQLDYDALRAAGATLGSGAVIVLGPGRSVWDMLAAIMVFFKHESCGKCVPCRVGTARLAAASVALAASAADGETDEVLHAGLRELVSDAERIAKASLCPLGQSPILALRSAANNLLRYK